MAYYLFNFTKKGASKGKPLHSQAELLLETKLWGIGAKTHNRDRLAAGDRFLAYVGAPERRFVGHGVLSHGTHDWTADESDRYPEDWHSGVSIGSAEVFGQPVPIDSVWKAMPSSASNPRAQFFGGVVQIKRADYEALVSAAGVIPAPLPTTSKPEGDPIADRLFVAAQHLKNYLKDPVPLSEDATRAHFMNRYLEALGYTSFGDVEYGLPVDSGDVADYVLRAGGEQAVVVEAKKIDSPLGAKEAAQVVKYASVLGVRWAVLCDGRYVQLYDPRVPGVAPIDRLVFEVDLAKWETREDFDVFVVPTVSLLARHSVADGQALERRAAREAIRDLLTTPESASVSNLRTELKKKKLIEIASAELADLLAEMLD